MTSGPRGSAPLKRRLRAGLATLGLAVVGWLPSGGHAEDGALDTDAVGRGAVVFHAGGCYSCHTDVKNGGEPLAGGRALDTPFGIFYSPNITPDAETGIGGWSEADLARALREGIAPDGSHYFPVFPYTSFTGMSDRDVRDLKAYIDSRPAVRQPNRPHDVSPPFGWRFLMAPWKWLFFESERFAPDPQRSESWNRGAYLATALAHCGECHTPRNALGALDTSLWYAGTKDGPEGELAPNITPHGATGIGRWSEGDLVYLLKSGFKPDFDNVQGLMEEAIENSYKHLSDDDLKAIAEYVLSLPPIENQVETKSGSSDSGFD